MTFTHSFFIFALPLLNVKLPVSIQFNANCRPQEKKPGRFGRGKINWSENCGNQLRAGIAQGMSNDEGRREGISNIEQGMSNDEGRMTNVGNV
jgi:hypothetical protein